MWRKVLVQISITLSIVFIGGGAFSYYNYQKAQTLKLIQSPQRNDVYILEKKIIKDHTPLREKYVIAQINSVTETELIFRVSNFVYLRVSDAVKGIRTDKLLTRRFFSNKLVRLAKSEIEQHWLNGTISKVGRSANGIHLYGGIINHLNQPTQKIRNMRQGGQANQQAISYYQGNMGYEQDIDEAFRLFKQAAHDGHPYAQINLAQMYRDGESVEVNYNQALYWFSEARKQGIAYASEEYSELCAKITSYSEK
ncbi:tetratricopeptide repeat protein [Thalassotalea maritima]|uniref:tetratricopeptide repeat protein n=1 Tax=Thalassotalea maritima TaxID=3242416 RepID=UPI003527A7B8